MRVRDMDPDSGRRADDLYMEAEGAENHIRALAG